MKLKSKPILLDKMTSETDIEVICYGLMPSTPEFVFKNEKNAQRLTHGDFSVIEVAGQNYYLSDYGRYQQGRTLAELMYTCLYRDNIVNNQLLHTPKRMFGQVSIENRDPGTFIRMKSQGNSPFEVHKMPAVKDLRDCLIGRSFFTETPYKIDKNGFWPLIDFLNLVLRETISNPEEVLQKLITNYNARKGGDS